MYARIHYWAVLFVGSALKSAQLNDTSKSGSDAAICAMMVSGWSRILHAKLLVLIIITLRSSDNSGMIVRLHIGALRY